MTRDQKCNLAVSLAVCAVLIISCDSFLAAQVAGGTVSGTVKDSSGAIVVGAQVVVTNSDTGVIREAVTNDEGFYSAPNLLPGTYVAKFSARGYKTEERSQLQVTVGASVGLDQILSVGSISESIEVKTEIPPVQLATSDISDVVNATTVRELPLNGRSWTDLAQLQPGVSAIHTQPDFSAGTDRGNRGFGQQLTISGARPQQNNYRLDGVSLNDYANGAPGSVLGGSLGVDAIEEFSVITSNYAADYGKTSGGVVNAITRSGTNQIHGSVYEFLRNSKLDAKNYFDIGAIPPFKRNQFGGTIGGPIIKDRTFFFADFEAIRQSKGLSEVTTVPSAAARAGNVHDQNTGAALAPIAVDPKAAAFFTFWHLPDSTSPSLAFGDLGLYTFASQQIVNENFFTARVDHNISRSDTFFATYMYDRTPYSSPDGLNNVEFGTTTARQFASLEETHIFTPKFVNTIRLGGNHEAVNNNQSLRAINPDAARTDLGVGGTAFAGRDAPQVLIGGGITSFSGGIGGSPTYYFHWNSIQGYDDAFYTRGTHSLRFGGSIEHMALNVVSATDPNGIFHFPDLPSFLTNSPNKFQGGIASTLTPRNLTQTLFGFYIQDDWHWKPSVTFNLGLRYEATTVIRESAGKLANLRNISDASPHLGNPFFKNPTLKDFEPRVGFAWDVFHNGKTALRGGVGMFDVQPLPYQFILLTNQSAPFFSYTAINNPPQGSFYSGITNFPANTLRSTYVADPKRNYIVQFNLNVQQQITPTLAAMVAYVGSRGVHQPFKVDEADLVIPTKTPSGYLWPKVDVFGNVFSPLCNATDPNGPPDGTTCAPPNTINPNFGAIRGLFYDGHSQFDALETQLVKRLNHGLQLQGNFTWSKSIDTSSASTAGDTFGNSISSLNWFDLRLGRGLSDFNVGRTFIVNGTWELPSRKFDSAAAQWAAGGWQLGLIFTASDGVPFTATWATGSDPAGTLSSDDWSYPNRLTGPGCNTLTNPGNPNAYIKTNCFQVPTAPTQAFWNANCDPAPPSLGVALQPGDLRCFNLRGNSGRNILTGPGVTSLDFSLFKNNYVHRISEKFNIQFRAEIFNILNHPNFAPPTTPDNIDIFDGTGAPTGVAGKLSKTTTTAREAQFAVKVIF